MKKKAKTSSDKEAAKAFEKAEVEAKELKAKLSREAKDEIKEWKDKEMKKWEQEKSAMKKDMEKSTVEMAIAIASKVIGKEVDKKDHAALVSSSLKELEKAL
jgi:F-type H+-transporting ATPase subunit b